jgi:N,N'-diacetyllegionaminate synthase
MKMPSGELTHRALVEHAVGHRLPLLISTGMATLDEVREALAWARPARGTPRGWWCCIAPRPTRRPTKP